MLRAKMHMDSARHKVQNEKRVKVMTGSHHKLVEMVQRDTHTGSKVSYRAGSQASRGSLAWKC